MHTIATTLHGYVEETGRTVTLEIGRDGREAEVVKVSSKETHDDDQREYRKAVADARKAHQEAMAAYTKAMRQHPGLLKAYKEELAAHKKRHSELMSTVLAKLAAFAESYSGKPLRIDGVGGGGSASAASTASSSPAASAEPSVPPPPERPTQPKPSKPAKPLPKGPCGCVATDLACRMRCTDKKEIEVPF